MAGIALDKAEVLAMFLETFFYGIYFTLFCISMYVLLSKSDGGANRPLIIASVIMMFLATGHVVLDFVRMVEAFVTKRDATKGGPDGYYSQIANPLHVAKTAFYVTLTLTGDSLVTWRCFVVYKRNWFVIILPMFLTTFSTVTGYVVTWVFSKSGPGSNIFHTAAAWIASFFVMTLCTNVYCTSAIVYRIWWSNRAAGAYRQYSLMPVILAVVESGALYSSALLALLITYLAGTNGQYVALDVVTPIVGIVFSLIIIQINVYTAVRVHNAASVSGAVSTRKSTVQQRMGQTVSAYPLQAVSVEITHTTDADSEDMRPQTRSPFMSESKQVPRDMWNAV